MQKLPKLSDKRYIVLRGYSLNKPDLNGAYIFASLDRQEMCVIASNKLNIDPQYVRTGDIFDVAKIDDGYDLYPLFGDISADRRRRTLYANICISIDDLTNQVLKFGDVDSKRRELYKQLRLRRTDDNADVDIDRQNFDVKISRINVLQKNEKAIESNIKLVCEYIEQLTKALDRQKQDFYFEYDNKEFLYSKIMKQVVFWGARIGTGKIGELPKNINGLERCLNDLDTRVYEQEYLEDRVKDRFTMQTAQDNKIQQTVLSIN